MAEHPLFFKLRHPPSGVPPDELFRSMLRAPRATADIQTRLGCAPDVRLSVRALRSSEWSSVGDAVRGIDEPERRDSVRFTQFIFLALMADGERAFDSAQQVTRLSRAEHNTLGMAVVLALGECSPTYVFSDVGSWERALLIGAEHPTNFTDAMLLYGSTDYSTGAVHGRPERYFGLRAGELTDGQFMAYSAARGAMKKYFNKDD